MRRQRSSTLRLLLLIALLVMAMWLLYRFYLQLPPAPSPPVKRAGPIVTVHAHA
jgi:hypothetical protein